MTKNVELKPSQLMLQDGTLFHGFSPHWQSDQYSGEIVFTTGMTGYIESLTDPSYAGQILVFTYPLIGNYGVPNKQSWESHKIHAAGVVVSEACVEWSHHSGMCSFLEWLQAQNIPLIAGVDTRQLTIKLRSYGVMLGSIGGTTFHDPNEEHLVSRVSVPTRRVVYHSQADAKKVIVVDCGLKENIIRCLQQYPLHLHQVPHDEDYSEEDFDGVFLSNGPGDPQRCQKTIAVLKKVMAKEKPIYGICLGAQILALAAGAKTYKLPFGHRGHNQPCMDERTKRCYITSQNHGYAIDASTLPEGWQVSFTNLNDGSVEGIEHGTLPFSAVQFHPEATPGPTDTRFFFDQFYQSMSDAKSRL